MSKEEQRHQWHPMTKKMEASHLEPLACSMNDSVASWDPETPGPLLEPGRCFTGTSKIMNHQPYHHGNVHCREKQGQHSYYGLKFNFKHLHDLETVPASVIWIPPILLTKSARGVSRLPGGAGFARWQVQDPTGLRLLLFQGGWGWRAPAIGSTGHP